MLKEEMRKAKAVDEHHRHAKTPKDSEITR